MNFQDLTAPERLALVSLCRTIVRLDRSYSREESQRLHEIAEELGDYEAFWELLEQSEQTVSTPQQLEAATRAVTRPEARQLILDVLEGLGSAETMSRAEEQMLSEIRGFWSMPA